MVFEAIIPTQCRLQSPLQLTITAHSYILKQIADTVVWIKQVLRPLPPLLLLSSRPPLDLARYLQLLTGSW